MKTLMHYNLTYYLSIVLCLFLIQGINGQEKKLPLTKDFSLWGQTDIGSVSPCGIYFTYTTSYETGKDTLFVQNVNNTAVIAIPGGRYGRFSNKNLFACLENDVLLLYNLKTLKCERLGRGEDYTFSSDGSFFYTIGNTLHVLNSVGSPLIKLDGIISYSVSSDAQYLAYCSDHGFSTHVMVRSLSKSKETKEVIHLEQSRFKDFCWSADSKAFAFSSYSSDDKERHCSGIYLYSLPEKKLSSYIPEESKTSNINSIFSISSRKGLSISKDHGKVFVQMNLPGKNEVSTDVVQVWNAADKYIYPEAIKQIGNQVVALAVWTPLTGEIKQVTSDTLSSVLFVGDDKHVVLWDPSKYEPQFNYSAPLDFYVKNIETDVVEVLLEKQSPYMLYVLPSPKGKFIAYYQEGEWWLYDPIEKKHIPVFKGRGIHFSDSIHDISGERLASGFAGWTKNDESFIIYDDFDLWEYTVATSQWLRLTHGREKKIKYRVSFEGDNRLPNYNGWKSKSLDFDNDLLLIATGEDGCSGYFYLKQGRKEEVIVYEAAKIDQLIRVKNGYLFRKQRFDSPAVIQQTDNKGQIKKIINTNKHHSKYDWGHAEALYYTDSIGRPLKGFICYPPNYDPKKKYPMIVSIYQRQFRDLHAFVPPSVSPGDGFNASAFTLQGYLVFFPDIHYVLGETGSSALRCTVAGVQEIINRGIVDARRIGLIGHSFGGYEANYIVTQTNVFSAVVSGAGASDLTSFYLTLNWDTGKPDMWRMEHQQWRLGASYFDSPETYQKNSPITYATNITTPLLSWTGERDYQVSWLQSVEFYLALRRLRKEHTLLVYPDEGHNLQDQAKQRDLFLKVSDWFEYYLKDGPKMPWMTPQ